MVGMCARLVRGLLDVDDVSWARGSQGPPRSLSIPSWKTTRRAARGGVRLQRQDQPGFCVSWRCSGVLPCIPDL